MLILSPVAVLFLPALFVFLDYCLTASTVTEFLVQAKVGVNQMTGFLFSILPGGGPVGVTVLNSLPSILLLLVLALPAATGVQCQVCFEDGHASDACPLNTGVAANVVTVAAAIGAKKVIDIAKLLPTYLCRLFSRGVLQTLVSLAQRTSAATGFTHQYDHVP